MKCVDFLFIYEVKARELENICLLRYELERRGYTVEFINTWYYIKRKVPKYKAKVVITFALYNDSTYNFVLNYVSSINKLINMQWEQVGTVSDDKLNQSQFMLNGMALNASHICWGEITRDRLHNKCGIDNRKLLLTGHTTLDFLREDLLDYYVSRDELFREYNISPYKKVCLFISSFSYVDLPSKIVDNTPELGFSVNEFIQVSITSQEEVLTWMTKILNNRDDIIFIYRPHPAEANSKKLKALVDHYSNFYVISDLSVKQWIIACDILYTWYSTSLAEIYASGKGCNILRPLPIPKEMELSICTEAIFICDFESFEATLDNSHIEFPIKDDIILQYYYIDDKEPAYKKTCDKFIDVYNDDYYLIPKSMRKKRIPLIIRFKQLILKSLINNIIDYLSTHTKINIPVLDRRRKSKSDDYDTYMTDLAERNYASDKEINDIIQKIKTTLEKT